MYGIKQNLNRNSLRYKYPKEHGAWRNMKYRCYNPNSKNYSAYGGRSITVYASWLTSFANFLVDVGKAPTINHSLDRIDNDGNYEPSNVKWSTAMEQADNTRRYSYIKRL